jgi:hypothetical protein
MEEVGMNRRTFVGAAVAGAAGALAPALQGQGSKPSTPKKTISIKIDLRVFAPPDYERVLDILQEKACVNTLMVKTLGYPGRDKQSCFQGGNSTVMHAQYYKDTILKPEIVQAPSVAKLDVFARLITTAKKRGMKTYNWVSETHSSGERRTNPIDDSLWDRDLYGRVAGGHPAGPCSNNPNYRNFVLGLFEDYARSYEIDGIMWGVERQGPLSNALGAFHNGARVDPGKVTCFCEFCVSKAKQRGIDVERAKEGYRELEKFVRAGRAGKRPGDGYYVTFWRTILRYPEILAWHKLWTDSCHEIHKGIHDKLKSVNPQLLAGWHIWHNISFNSIFRSDEDFVEMSKYSDFFDPVLYNGCAGARLASYVDSVGANLYGDIPKDELLEFEYQIMGYHEKKHDELSAAGLSADYVYRETKRSVDYVAGTKAQIWPGIGIDVPGGTHKDTPEFVRDAVAAAMRAGAEGVVLSRSYSEMKPENLAGAGQAIRELGLA